MKILYSFGPKFVVLKGGHINYGEYCMDIIFDGESYHDFFSKRIDISPIHGTGCAFSSAISAYLALGYNEIDAVRKAKEFVLSGIKKAKAIGKGSLLLDFFDYIENSNEKK